MDAKQEILDAIEIMVDKKISEKCPQIYNAYCNSTMMLTAEMVVNNKLYNLPFYGVVPTPGNKYPVFIPNGDMSQAFVINANGGKFCGGQDEIRTMLLNYPGVLNVSPFIYDESSAGFVTYVSTVDGIPSDTFLTGIQNYYNDFSTSPSLIGSAFYLQHGLKILAPTKSATASIYLQLAKIDGKWPSPNGKFSTYVDTIKGEFEKWFKYPRLGGINWRQISAILNNVAFDIRYNIIVPKNNSQYSDKTVVYTLGRVTCEAMKSW